MFVAASGPVFTQTAARDTGIDADADYIPGSSEIEENAILKRMERELGQEFTPRSRRVERPESRKRVVRSEVKGPPEFSVGLVLGDERRIDGRVAFSQAALELTEKQNGIAVRHRIPLGEIGQVEFLEWQAVRLHRDPRTGDQRVIYFPTRCRLTRRDQRQLEGEFAAFDWLQFRMQSGLTFGSYRTYFSVVPGQTAPASSDAGSDSGTDGATETAPNPAAAKPGPIDLATLNQAGGPNIPVEIVRSIVFTGGPAPADGQPTNAGDRNKPGESSDANQAGDTGGANDASEVPEDGAP